MKRCIKIENDIFLTLTICSILTLTSCGRHAALETGPIPQETPDTSRIDYGKTPTISEFANDQTIPFSGFSTNLTGQQDTLCVDLSGKTISQLVEILDALATDILPADANWYSQYKLNDQDYVNNCLGAFPKTFTSARTGQSHTVTSNASCRAVTSDVVSTEYFAYINGGGTPVVFPAKIKASGCSGGVAPFIGRLQSVHGSMMSDYASIP